MGRLCIAISLCCGLLANATAAVDLPWREAGWSEREAAAHLLDRLSFGPRPGEIDHLIETGLDVWVEKQLSGQVQNPELASRLRQMPSQSLSQQQIATTYLSRKQILRQAQRAGVVPEDLGRPRDRGDAAAMDPRQRRELRQKVHVFAEEQGYRSERELYAELIAHKIVRAAISASLSDVLTDFWFNHFNVSITENDVRPFITSYERDAIRAHLLGSFRDMLEATAKHPAMLLYLDNARSIAAGGTETTLDTRRRRSTRRQRSALQRQGKKRRSSGLNENYARELLELHTLGVAGGYDQQDVIEVARAFTGWALVPPSQNRERLNERASRARRVGLGFVFEEEFLFRADVHDAEAKTVLGHQLPAGRGIEDGLEVLDLLAAHPSTARHLATKLAVRFVSDEPPATLIVRLAQSFSNSQGDLRAVMRTLVESPEFWSLDARRQKIKSPFELVISALRVVDAEVNDPASLADWIARIGQPLYAYQAPTGYPDRATAWVNTGSLLQRMNFGLHFADERIEGVSFDLAALNNHRQPESLDDALHTYVELLLPERDPDPVVRQLETVIRDPGLASKVARSSPPSSGTEELFTDEVGGEAPPTTELSEDEIVLRDQLAQVVGVILGSPEFQRR